jgi:hypothetical protein
LTTPTRRRTASVLGRGRAGSEPPLHGGRGRLATRRPPEIDLTPGGWSRPGVAFEES